MISEKSAAEKYIATKMKMGITAFQPLVFAK